MSEAQTQLVKLMTDMLSQNVVQTKEDAVKLYETLSTSLALHIAAGLPPLESKAFLALTWVEKKEVRKVEATCPGKNCFCKFAPIK